MRKIHRIPRRLALIAFGVIGLSLTVAVTGAKAANERYTAGIYGPATVWDGYSCTWEAGTDIPNPTYQWEGPSGVIGTNSSVTYTYYRANGAHQILKLTVRNAAGASASDYLLVGVFINGSGDPECP